MQNDNCRQPKPYGNPFGRLMPVSQIAYFSYSLGNYPKSFNAVAEGLAITDDPASEENNWRINAFSGDGDPHKARLFIAAAIHQIFAFLYSGTDNIAKAEEQFNMAI